MPPQEQAFRNDKAIYWPRTGTDGYGQPTIGSAIELLVRWNDVYREKTDAQGNTIIIEADVVVDRIIPISSQMWKGGLMDLPGTAQVPEENVMYVVSYNGTPDAKGREISHTVKLARSKNALPSGA